MPILGLTASFPNVHAPITFRIREMISSQPPLIALDKEQTRGLSHLQTCSVGLYSGE